MATKARSSAKKSQTTRRDYQVMTDSELFQELARLYNTLLARLNNHLQVGTGEDGEAEPMPEALEAGITLARKLDALNGHFERGVFGNEASLLEWNWGFDTFETKLKRAAADLTLAVDDDWES